MMIENALKEKAIKEIDDRPMDDTILHYLLHKKKKMGRPAIPKEKRREVNKVSVYLNNEEFSKLNAFVGEGSTSDAVRKMILEKVG